MVKLALSKTWPLLLLLICFLSPVAQGDGENFLSAYKQGLSDLEYRQWPEMAENMRQAIAGRPDESGKLMKRGYMRRYLPHYFLGVALAEQGRCEEAEASWRESESQGVIKKRKLYKTLLSYRERCQTYLEQLPPLERQLAELEKRAERQAVSSSTLKEAFGKARKDLKTARTSLDLARLVRIENLLSEAQRELGALERRIASQRAEPEVKTKASLTPKKTRPRTPAPKAAPQTTPSPLSKIDVLLADLDLQETLPDGVADLRARLEEIYDEVKGNPADEELLADLERAHQRLRRTLDPPPDALQEAVQTYIEGDYNGVLKVLADIADEPDRTMAHVHLLRSASHFALHGIQADQEQLVRARQEAQAALAARPDLTLSERFFSPRFRDLVQTLEPDEFRPAETAETAETDHAEED